jgi:four helix bundle protein
LFSYVNFKTTSIMYNKKFDLEERFVDFSSLVIDVVEALPSRKAGNYIGNQLIRCDLAPALNYGEAQSAESRDDFIHKIKISLKELKETRICLKVINKREMVNSGNLIIVISKENEELIAILSKSIDTVRRNSERKT